MLALMGYGQNEDGDVMPLANVPTEPLPFAILCDHDAEDRATLERRLGMKTTAAVKNVSGGIQAVANRLRTLPGREELPVQTKIAFFRDALDEVDPYMIECKKPKNTVEEYDGYVWDTRSLLAVGEQPLKLDDHGCDTSRYVVAHLDGIGDMKAKDVAMDISPIASVVGFHTKTRELGERRAPRQRVGQVGRRPDVGERRVRYSTDGWDG
jgi:hypothetical protein